MSSVSSITSNGITWTFVSNVSAGQYINGDWWVLGPVALVSISPSSTVRDNGSYKNGSMLASKLSGDYQGFDESIGIMVAYNPDVNAGEGISIDSLLVVPEGDRLISVSSSDTFPPISTAAVLTSVSSAPPDLSFRPGYTDFSRDYVESNDFYSNLNRILGDFDIDSILTKTAPAVDAILSSVSSFWFDAFVGPYAKLVRPFRSMPTEDSELAALVSDASLALNINTSYWDSIEKSSVATYLTQIGIDNYSNLVNLGSRWAFDGPTGSGKKFPILFAGVMTQNQDMIGVGKNYPVVYGSSNVFSEDTQTFIVSSINGVINYGFGGYTSAMVGLPEWGQNHWNGAFADNSQWVNTSSYGSDLRRFFTMKNWGGQIFAAKLMGMQYIWNHDPLFYYFNRYYEKELEIQPTVSATNIKESLAPNGREWQYDFISGANSFYFEGNSSSTVDGVEYVGISSKFDLLLYTSSFTRSLSSVELNPIIAGSATIIIGEPRNNADFGSSSILYVNRTVEDLAFLKSTSAGMDKYTLRLPYPEVTLQAIWLDSDSNIIGSTNALRLSLNQPY
jgi:hypothetical protein